MSDAAALTEPDTCPPGAAERPLDRRLRMLDRLAEAGLEIALVIERKVKAAEPAQTLAELDVAARAYARAARAVRLAVLLQDQLARAGEDPEESARQAEVLRRKTQVDRAVRVIRRVAKDHCRKDGYTLSVIARQAAERLDDDDIYGLVATRPVGELVAMICDDLGLQPDWDYLATEAWAQAEIASGAAGSPFLKDDDDEAAAEEAAEPDPGPARPAWRPETFHEKLAALARDPEIIAAARRDSG